MKRKYIYTNKRHSNRAVMSTILGILSTASLLTVIYLSFRKEGNIPSGYGFTGLFAVLFSLIGFIMGIMTVRDKAYYRLFPCLGILFNGIALGMSALIIYVAVYI